MKRLRIQAGLKDPEMLNELFKDDLAASDDTAGSNVAALDLSGEVVVMTGPPQKPTRKADMAKIIQSLGAKVEPNFTSRTTMVVFNQNNIKLTSKLKKAKSAGLATMSYQEVFVQSFDDDED